MRSEILENMDIRKIFPHAMIVKASCPDIEDDYLFLTNTLHIQLGIDFYHLILSTKSYSGMYTFKYIITTESLSKALKAAINHLLPLGIGNLN